MSWHQGERVEVDAHVGDDAGGDVRGIRGKVVGDNCSVRSSDGVPRVAIITEDRQLLGVPAAALRKRGTR